MSYGVVPEGFARRSLAELLLEIEAGMIAIFGPGVIQTSQSPLGQLNGLFADLSADFWETTEDTYQSFDVDQAEGLRLDMLAKLRRLSRNNGESDADFRLRITNQGQANIKLTANINRLKNLPGVTYAWAIENSTAAVNDYGMPPHSVAYAVTGGDDEDVALAIYQLTVSGIGLYGNTNVVVVADGYCQHVRFIRPDEIRIRVEVDVRHIPDASGCAPPAAGQLQAMLIGAFAGDDGFKNGATVEERMIASEVARLGDLEIVDVRIARQSTLIVEEALATTIFERPVIISPDVQVRYVT